MPKGDKKVSVHAVSSAMVDETMDAETVATSSEAESKNPSYFVEIAKTGRAMCKKCDEKIDNKTIRIGVITEGEWGLFTRWQHLSCTIFHKSCDSVEKIDNYKDMTESDRALIDQRFQESQNEVDDDMKAINPDELVRDVWKHPMEPSSDLLMPLLPYQKEGLGWMIHQEQSQVHGGILADEMGMGKTIQAISLMLTNRPSLRDPTTLLQWDECDTSHEFQGTVADRGGTLIILPTVAIRQWQTEISRFTREGSMSVTVYHGNNRNTSHEDLLGYDVVITSYKILEMEYRKATAGIKIQCRICGKRYYPEKLRVHRKFFCGETAQRSEAQSKTQKKRNEVGPKKRGANEEDSSSEDEIAKQKKANKLQPTATPSKKKRKSLSVDTSDDSDGDEIVKQKEVKKKIVAKQDTKARIVKVEKKLAVPKKSTPKKSSGSISDDLSTSSEDEIARQKLENKRIAAEREKATKVPVKRTTNAKRTTPAKESFVKEEAMSTSSEDEIARQKLENKKRADEELAMAKQTPISKKRRAPVKANSSTKKPRVESEGTGSKKKKSVDVDSPILENKNQTLYFDSSSEDNHCTPELSPQPTNLRPKRAAAIVASQKSLNQKMVSISDDSDDGGNYSEFGDSEEVKSSGDRSDDTNEFSEDGDIAAQRKPRKAPLKNFERKSSSVSTPRSSSKLTPAKGSAKKTESKTKSPVAKAVKLKREVSSRSKGKKSLSSTKSKPAKKKDSDDDEYEHESESSEEDDSAIDEDEADDESVVIAPKASKKSPLSAQSEDSVVAGLDEDVEAEIREALLEHKKATKNSPVARSLLHLVSWFRIILDEAHMIKDRSTSTCKAVFNLVSLNKWCLTGTPLQNRVGELYSQIRFLRIDPHAYYFCRSKGCNCKSLHYRFTNSRCDDCSHSVIQHFCHFNRHILNPIQRCGFVNEGRKALLMLKTQILDDILLRRTKTTRADDIQLPMRIVQVRQEKMDEKEEDFYHALYTQSQAQFNTYLMTGTVLNNYAHIFDILIRLRQAVDHPYLVIYSDSQGNNSAVTAAAAAADEANRLRRSAVVTPSSDEGMDTTDLSTDQQICGDCGLCQDPFEDPVSAACGHTFCRSCIVDYVATVSAGLSDDTSVPTGSTKRTTSNIIRCPDCSEALTLSLDPPSAADNRESNNSNKSNLNNSIWNDNKRRRKSILNKIDLKHFQTSTKMEALMEELYRMGEEDVGSKAIVFSQFVNMLDLLEYRIQIGGIGCVKLQGSLTVEQRDKVINNFKEDPNIRVLLISLKAGGVALNLTVASRIFLMDPWWNPAAEMQAIDRTHRIGQYKPIFATRFIIENSIEERILKLQEKKRLVFDSTVGGDAGSMNKLTVDDMRFLFQ